MNYIEYQIKHAFNEAAKTYDESCALQTTTGDDLLIQLKQQKIKFKNIFDLGCGTGIVTEKIALHFHYQTFVALDIADKLLKIAEKRLRPYSIQLLEKNFEHIHNNKNIDLIFSNMALQWSADLAKLLSVIHAALANDGYLAFSLPLQGTFAELPYTSKNHFYPQKDISQWLHEAGFDEIDYKIKTISLQFDSLLTALKSIKAVGANYLMTKQSQQIIKNHQFLSAIKNHKSHFCLTYKIGYFIAQKKRKTCL